MVSFGLSPAQINFDLFVQDTEPGRSSGYTLRLLSAVCHKGGRSVQSGHYIAYVVDNGALLRFDDLAPGSRVGRAGGLEDITAVLYSELARDAYFLLYELVRFVWRRNGQGVGARVVFGDPVVFAERSRAGRGGWRALGSHGRRMGLVGGEWADATQVEDQATSARERANNFADFKMAEAMQANEAMPPPPSTCTVS